MAVAVAVPAAEANNAPTISMVTFAPGNPYPTQMNVFGSGFGIVKPAVTLNGVMQTVSSSTDTRLTVTLSPSPLPAGTYALIITNQTGQSHGSDDKDDERTVEFAVTVGATGAQGPQGIPGPQGPQGWPECRAFLDRLGPKDPRDRGDRPTINLINPQFAAVAASLHFQP